jgi:hypothetical protein
VHLAWGGVAGTAGVRDSLTPDTLQRFAFSKRCDE